MRKQDGTTVQNRQDITKKVLEFHEKLMGNIDRNLNQIDIVDMRRGKQLNLEERGYLISRISKEEIYKALQSIRDLKAPGLDGFGAKFFQQHCGFSNSQE